MYDCKIIHRIGYEVNYTRDTRDIFYPKKEFKCRINHYTTDYARSIIEFEIIPGIPGRAPVMARNIQRTNVTVVPDSASANIIGT
jgi:hypothetical protein